MWILIIGAIALFALSVWLERRAPRSGRDRLNESGEQARLDQRNAANNQSFRP